MRSPFQRGIWIFLMSLGLAALLACSPTADSTFFRDTKARFSSTTRFDPAQFAGFWHIRQEFSLDETALFRSGVEFRSGADGTISQVVLHGIRGNGQFDALNSLAVDQVAAGRLVHGVAPYDTQYWVLWVDADYRTAAIGTPSGSFGWIIDRNRTGGEDRIKAARDILDWNGYDLTKLRKLP